MSTAPVASASKVGRIIRELEPLNLKYPFSNSTNSSPPTTSSTSAATSKLPCLIVKTTASDLRCRGEALQDQL